jgi:phage/plasmid-like protein (TIGR03299 family)
MNTENITIEGFGKASRGFDNAETTVIMNTNAQPLAWDGIAGCRSFSNPVTVSEAAAEVGANYEVKKHHLISISDELYEAITNHTPLTQELLSMDNIVSSHMATVREDSGKVLGVVGKDYGVVQNAASMEFFNHILNGDVSGNGEKAVISTAGILDGGGRFYITAKMNSDLHIHGDNSPIEDYLLLTNSHDGTGSVTVLFTPIRVICRNTLMAALRGAKNKLVYRHTSRVNERMDLTNEINFKRAAEVLKFHETYKKAFVEDLERLREIKLTNLEIMDMACRIFADDQEMKEIKAHNYKLDGITTDILSTRKKNLIMSLMESIDYGVGQDTNRGTGLFAYNGITTWANNGRAYKDNESKFDSIIAGDMAKKTQLMHDMILEYAN